MMTDQLIPDDLLTRAKVTGGLRQLADYLDRHPGVPVCRFGWDLNAYLDRSTDETERTEIDRIAAILGVAVTDDTPGGHYRAIRTFGLITYQAIHVPARRRAIHHVEMSYTGCVTPDDPGAGVRS